MDRIVQRIQAFRPASLLLGQNCSRSVSTLNASNRPATNGIPRPNVPINTPDEKLPMEFERNLFRNAVKDEASIARQRIAQDSTMSQQNMDQMLIKNATKWIKRKTQLGRYRK